VFKVRQKNYPGRIRNMMACARNATKSRLMNWTMKTKRVIENKFCLIMRKLEPDRVT
jgi:hypothetical protein